MKIINLFAGPGAGKSTTSAGLFWQLKSNNFAVELVTEYAKGLVYENHTAALEDQLFVFANQNRQMARLLDHSELEYVITDSPLLLSAIYGYTSLSFKDLVFETFYKYNNINFFLSRDHSVHEYRTYGRTHTEDQARDVDERILRLLSVYNIPFHTVPTKQLNPILEILHGKV